MYSHPAPERDGCTQAMQPTLENFCILCDLWNTSSKILLEFSLKSPCMHEQCLGFEEIKVIVLMKATNTIVRACVFLCNVNLPIKHRKTML